MTVILGSFGFDSNAASAADEPLQTSMVGGTQLRLIRKEGSVLTGWARGAYIAESEELSVIVAGRPRSSNGFDGNVSPAETALRTYRSHGDGFLGHLRDNFALALIDQRARRIILAVDRMGVERLTYRMLGRRLLFSTSAMQLGQMPGANCSLRRQAIFDYLMMHMVPGPQTVFEGVSKLQAGTCVSFDDNGIKVSRYWLPEFEESRAADTADLETGLHDSLARAVERCQPGETTGAFLSGGLDSSTVTGVLGKVTGRSPRTFSMGFGVAEYNELEYARIAAKHFDAAAVEYELAPADIVDAIPRIAVAYDEPFGNSSAVPTYVCAKVAAAHGVNHLLAGDGGDEIFGGNSRYVLQKRFEPYKHVPAFFRKRLIEPGTRLINPESRVMPLRKLRSYVDQARLPMPERGEYWNLLYRSDLGTFLDDDFRSSINRHEQLANMQAVFDAAPSRNLLHQMLFYDWQFTLADNDLRKVTTMCELAGVRVSYPMLDSDVIDLSLRIPPDVKIERGDLRSFYKRAMRGFLPREILEKKKHGFGLPFGVWLKTDRALADTVYGLLNDLKSRRIVQPRFLDQLIEDHRGGHASYFGYAIWDLALLEAWMSTHRLNIT